MRMVQPGFFVSKGFVSKGLVSKGLVSKGVVGKGVAGAVAVDVSPEGDWAADESADSVAAGFSAMLSPLVLPIGGVEESLTKRGV
jgi:hypothetical protein